MEVILWFANKRPGIDFHSVLKLLFFADVYHLNHFGRPIVGDQYRALPYGPVPQTTYDILKGDPLALEEIDGADLPFDVEGRFNVRARRAPDTRKLSASDIEALEHAWNEFADLNFRRRTDMSHRHPAYSKAIESAELVMDYADFLEANGDAEKNLEELRETAHRLII